MERWHNRVAVVTGAGSGIGAATVKQLLKANLIVAGLDLRPERLDTFKQQLPADQQKRFHPYQCDVSAVASVNAAFDKIIKDLKGVDILVNNAGIVEFGQLTTLEVEKLQRTVQVNIMGVVHCTQRAFKSMKERNVDGHVLITNSQMGHWPNPDSGVMNIYAPTKYALTAATEVYRQDFANAGTKIKITSISPSMTDTPIVPNEMRESAKTILKPEDVAQCILFAISTPPHVQIYELTVLAV